MKGKDITRWIVGFWLVVMMCLGAQWALYLLVALLIVGLEVNSIFSRRLDRIVKDHAELTLHHEIWITEHDRVHTAMAEAEMERRRRGGSKP